MTLAEPLAKANLADLREETGLDSVGFFGKINALRASSGAVFPAFRYERSWENSAKAIFQKCGGVGDDWILLACSWGLGQKAGWIYCSEQHPNLTIEQLKTFMWQPGLQYRQVAKDIEALLRHSGNLLPLAATRYNAGSGADIVTQYGTKVAAIEQGVRTLLEKEGLPICLESLPQSKRLI